jgi:hypothetical protein
VDDGAERGQPRDDGPSDIRGDVFFWRQPASATGTGENPVEMRLRPLFQIRRRACSDSPLDRCPEVNAPFNSSVCNIDRCNMLRRCSVGGARHLAQHAEQSAVRRVPLFAFAASVYALARTWQHARPPSQSQSQQHQRRDITSHSTKSPAQQAPRSTITTAGGNQASAGHSVRDATKSDAALLRRVVAAFDNADAEEEGATVECQTDSSANQTSHATVVENRANSTVISISAGQLRQRRRRTDAEQLGDTARACAAIDFELRSGGTHAVDTEFSRNVRDLLRSVADTDGSPSVLSSHSLHASAQSASESLSLSFSAAAATSRLIDATMRAFLSNPKYIVIDADFVALERAFCLHPALRSIPTATFQPCPRSPTSSAAASAAAADSFAFAGTEYSAACLPGPVYLMRHVLAPAIAQARLRVRPRTVHAWIADACAQVEMARRGRNANSNAASAVYHIDSGSRNRSVSGNGVGNASGDASSSGSATDSGRGSGFGTARSSGTGTATVSAVKSADDSVDESNRRWEGIFAFFDVWRADYGIEQSDSDNVPSLSLDVSSANGMQVDLPSSREVSAPSLPAFSDFSDFSSFSSLPDPSISAFNHGLSSGFASSPLLLPWASVPPSTSASASASTTAPPSSFTADAAADDARLAAWSRRQASLLRYRGQRGEPVIMPSVASIVYSESIAEQQKQDFANNRNQL